jgi:hypothetical protein
VTTKELESLAVHLFRPFFLLSCPALAGFGLGGVRLLLQGVFESEDPWLQQGWVARSTVCLKSNSETRKLRKRVAMHPVEKSLGIGSCMFPGVMPAEYLREPTADDSEMCFPGDEICIGGLTLGCLEGVSLRVLVRAAPVFEIARRVGAELLSCPV